MYLQSVSDHLGVRVRFAPSPTGHLHLGGLRTALFNFLFARHYSGSYLLRIEDTDTDRSRVEYVESIVSSLRWANLLPDEPMIIQTDRDKEHRQEIERLLEKSLAYRCYCTAQEIAQRCKKSVTQTNDFFFSYDEFCRNVDRLDSGPYVIRFAMPLSNDPIVFNDLIRGPISFERSYFDDFIIARSDGRPVYNFVAVVDDAHMRITHVIRGEDHIANTPKQILLYKALEYGVPQFAHLPMILGPGGNRLSKRDGAVSVLDYQLEGYFPEALENYLARLGWSYGDQEVFSHAELIDYFTLEGVSKKGACFDVAKLGWMNSVYIKSKSALELLAYMESYPWLALSNHTSWPAQDICQTINLYKDRVKTLRELREAVLSVCNPVDLIATKSFNHDGMDAIHPHMDKIYELLLLIHDADWKEPNLAACIKGYCAQHAIKFVNVAQPLRLALTGSSVGPGVSELLALIGKNESIRRLATLISTL